MTEGGAGDWQPKLRTDTSVIPQNLTVEKVKTGKGGFLKTGRVKKTWLWVIWNQMDRAR